MLQGSARSLLELKQWLQQEESRVQVRLVSGWSIQPRRPLAEGRILLLCHQPGKGRALWRCTCSRKRAERVEGVPGVPGVGIVIHTRTVWRPTLECLKKVNELQRKEMKMFSSTSTIIALRNTHQPSPSCFKVVFFQNQPQWCEWLNQF